MPKFEITVSDGRKFRIEANRAPNEVELQEFIKAIPQSGSIIEPNQEAIPSAPSLGMSTVPMVSNTQVPAPGMVGVMNPQNVQNLSAVAPTMQGVSPMGDVADPGAKLKTYNTLLQMGQEINARYDASQARRHEYPIIRALMQGGGSMEPIGLNAIPRPAGIPQPTNKPLWTPDPLQEQLYQETEMQRAKELATLDQAAKAAGFDKTPGMDFLSKLVEPKLKVGLGKETIQQGLGVGSKAASILAGAHQAVSSVPESLSSPLGVATLPMMEARLVGKPVAVATEAAFLGDMALHAPEQVMAAKQAIQEGDVEGAVRNLGQLALTTILTGKQLKEHAPGIKRGMDFVRGIPEVLPPEPKPQQRPLGPERQLEDKQGEIIDLERQGRNTYVPKNEGLKQIEGPKGQFVTNAKGQTVDMGQLTPMERTELMRGPREYVAPEVKKTFQGDKTIIGENLPETIARDLGVKYDGLQDFGGFGPKKDVYTSQDPKNPFTVYVEPGSPKSEVQARLQEKQSQDLQPPKPKLYTPRDPELPSKPIDATSGEVSFRAPAASEAIPSARQTANPKGDYSAPVIEPQKGPPQSPQSPPQSPQFQQGTQYSAPESKPLKSKTSKLKESGSINERNSAKGQQIKYHAGAELTKEAKDWITSKAVKLLNNTEELRYTPDRQGKFDGGQLVNRLLSNVPPVEKDLLEQAGIKEKFPQGSKVTKDETETWIKEHQPEAKLIEYGQTRKGREGEVETTERQALNELNHNWRDNLDFVNNANLTRFLRPGEGIIEDMSPAELRVLIKRDNRNWTPERVQEFVAKAIEYKRLNSIVLQQAELARTRRTVQEPQQVVTPSIYNSVSPVDTTNYPVTRTDVQVPTEKTKGRTLHVQDGMHEQRPNVFGWAASQDIVPGSAPGGQAVRTIFELQSKWGQKIRDLTEKAKKEVKFIEGKQGNPGGWYSPYGDGYLKPTKEEAIRNYVDSEKPSHPFVKDYARITLKAAIEGALKAGHKRLGLTTAESAVNTEGHTTSVMTARKMNGKPLTDVMSDFSMLLGGLPDLATYKTGDPLEGRSGFVAHLELIDAPAEVAKPKLEIPSDDDLFAAANARRPMAVRKAPKANQQTEQDYAKWRVVVDKEPYYGGHKFNYDVLAPKILDELTGVQSELVDMGKHKRVYTTDPASYPFQDKGRYMVRVWDLSKVAEAQKDSPFTFFGSDKLKEKPSTEEGKTQYYHSGIPLGKETIDAGKKAIETAGRAFSLYAEPMVDKLGRQGGPVTKQVAKEFRQMISRQKGHYGELTPLIDPGKKAAGSMGGGNTWLRSMTKITPKAGVNNFFRVMEGKLQPISEAQETLRLVKQANLAIGNLATKANPDFVPSNKPQRILTNYGYDIIRRGSGPAWDAFAEGTAIANNVPLAKVRTFLEAWKAELDSTSTTAASMDRISQDFTRKFPRTVTHVKPGAAWHEVVSADPYNYLEAAAQRTSHAVAFRETYPLVRDPSTGKLVPSGLLQATRKAVMKELNTTGGNATLFDNLVSAAQGHPLDKLTGEITSPDSTIGGIYRMANSVMLQPIKTLMLTANSINNAGEVVAGGPTIYLGAQNVVRAMAELAKDRNLEKYLEFIGARNQAMYNWSVDPTSPVRSGSRIASNVVRFGTAQQFLNEIQELTAAMSAKFVADKIRTNKMGAYEKQRVIAVARSFGMTRAEGDLLVNGDAKLLRQFETRAAAFLTAGNQSMGEKSRLGASRIVNELFWFQTYPQMTANRLVKLYQGIKEDIKNKDAKQAWHNSMLFGRLFGGMTTQGTITMALMGLATAGMYGIDQKAEQAKNETYRFVKDAILLSMGGPLAILSRLAENSRDSKSLVQNLVNLMPPAGIAQEFYDYANETGRYAGLSEAEKINTFLESKTPGYKVLRTAMSAIGLASDDLEMKAAESGFFEWRRRQPGYKPANPGGGTEQQLTMRAHMRKVQKLIRQGGDWKAELKKVEDIEGAAQSLKAGTMLELNTKPLDEAQLESLTKHIGKSQVEKLKTYDSMLRQIGRELGSEVYNEKKTIDEITPTGELAVDRTTDTARRTNMEDKLDPNVVSMLKASKMNIPGYDPELNRIKNKEQLNVEQASKYEDLLASEYNRRLAKLASDPAFLSKPLAKRRELIQIRLDLAKEIAQTRAIKGVPAK